jgi:glycosyltransferase involved in cell wall biosynthesis
MKILLAIDNLLGGGKERQFVELVKGLSQRSDFTLQVVVFYSEFHYKNIFNLGVRVTVIDKKEWFGIKGFIKLFQLLNRFKPDLVHSWHPLISLFLLPFKPFFGFRFIEGSVRSAAPKNKHKWFDYHATRISSFLAQATVANSKAGLAAFKIKNAPRFIYNGFDLGRIEGLSKVPAISANAEIAGTIRIGMVGNFTDNKDYDTFFSAAECLMESYHYLNFYSIGDGPGIGMFRAKYKDSQSIHLLGKIIEVEKFISEFDICVLCSTEYGEGISNSILEYMSLRKPVIALDCPGNREVIEEEVSGLFYTLRDSVSLSRQIERLIVNPELREKLGAAGFGTLITRFSFETMITAYASLYNEVTTINDNKIV